VSWTLAEIVMVTIIVTFVSLAGDDDFGIALALFLFARESGWISAWLRTPLMLTLGALSYSIYMVHIFVQRRLINVAGLVERKLDLGLIGDIVLRGQPAAGWAGIVAIVIMLAATIGASWITWRLDGSAGCRSASDAGYYATGLPCLCSRRGRLGALCIPVHPRR